ncbi:MAG: CBS domain-containing protein [Myxococcota bacterium]
MKTRVVTIPADDSLWVVQEIMEFGDTRHLPVVRLGELVGVVSERDLLRASLSSVMGLPAEEQKIFLEGVKISEVMSSPPIFIEKDESVQKAARTLAERKIGCLPVVEGGKLIGIVTETDVLEHFSGLDLG